MNKNALGYKYIAKTNVFVHLTFVETIGITGGGGHSGEFIQLNAEGARLTPNLSGKQTEHNYSFNYYLNMFVYLFFPCCPINVGQQFF